jgi:hypothetical protein
MFEAWGRVLSRRRRLTLIITLLFVAFAGAWGAPRPLRRLYARYGFTEEDPAPLPVPAGAPR